MSGYTIPYVTSQTPRGERTVDLYSRLLAAITVALGLTLGDLSSRVARSVPRGPLCLAA